MNKLWAVEFKESNYHTYIVVQVQLLTFQTSLLLKFWAVILVSLLFYTYPPFWFLRVANRGPQSHNPGPKFRTIT